MTESAYDAGVIQAITAHIAALPQPAYQAPCLPMAVRFDDWDDLEDEDATPAARLAVLDEWLSDAAAIVSALTDDLVPDLRHLAETAAGRDALAEVGDLVAKAWATLVTARSVVLGLTKRDAL